jgi:hypothetical protein
MGNAPKKTTSTTKKPQRKPTTTSASKPPVVQSTGFQKITDKFTTIEELQEGLRKYGLESSNLIIGVDYTKSNTWSGKQSFGGNCLHAIFNGIFNPYQEVISIIGSTLSEFDEDNNIPVFGFGDVQTKDKGIFSFFEGNTVAKGFQQVLDRYAEITPNVQLSGPTSFAPLIKEAINIVKYLKSYHILVIIADGQVDNKRDTTQAIIEASNYPLSIIMIGVGDGPWDVMQEFDDELVDRKFDNFQFVPFLKSMERSENREVTFSVAALQEIPDQYAAIKRLGLLELK